MVPAVALPPLPSLVAISQVELAVKLFWAQVYNVFPKPEVAEVGMTFAESEVRHANAYAHLLDLLGLETLFGRWLEGQTALRDRARALRDSLGPATASDLQWTGTTPSLVSVRGRGTTTSRWSPDRSTQSR